MDKDLVIILESLIHEGTMLKRLCLWASIYNKCVCVSCSNCLIGIVTRHKISYPVQLIQVFKNI